jgi:hypothetical protein
MKTLLALVILILNLGITKAQINLVPNPSFEDTITCNGSTYIESFINSWRGWLYYNSCLNSSRSVPNNDLGHQNAHSGMGYCGLGVYTKHSMPTYIRHYIQVELTGILQANKKYKTEFYVSASDVMHAKSNSIGVYFSTDSFFVSSAFLGLIDVVPQVQNNPNNDLSDTANWTLVSGSFIANGTERYLTIGNFLPDSLSNVIPLDSVCSQPNPFNCGVFFYIDDVSVVLDDDSGIAESLLANNIKIFPNPSKDVLRIEMLISFNGSIQIRDALGKEIFNANLQNNITNFTIDTKDFESGLYFISFRNEKGEVNKKFIKQ